jgi:hypothetical protein
MDRENDTIMKHYHKLVSEKSMTFSFNFIKDMAIFEKIYQVTLGLHVKYSLYCTNTNHSSPFLFAKSYPFSIPIETLHWDF